MHIRLYTYIQCGILHARTPRSVRHVLVSNYSLLSSSRLRVRPDAGSKVLDELQLLLHVGSPEQVAFFMRRETTLRGDADALQRFVYGLSRTARHDPCSVKHAFPEKRLVFELREFTGDETQDDRFVFGEMFQGFERAYTLQSAASKKRERKKETKKRTSALGVVLEVITIHVHLVEKLGCDRIVTSLREMYRVPKVTSTEV